MNQKVNNYTAQNMKIIINEEYLYSILLKVKTRILNQTFPGRAARRSTSGEGHY